MRKVMLGALLVAPLMVSGAWAQTPLRNLPAEGFKYLPSKDVEALTDKPGPGAKTAFPVDHENYYVEYAQRQHHIAVKAQLSRRRQPQHQRGTCDHHAADQAGFPGGNMAAHAHERTLLVS